MYVMYVMHVRVIICGSPTTLLVSCPHTKYTSFLLIYRQRLSPSKWTSPSSAYDADLTFLIPAAFRAGSHCLGTTYAYNPRKKEWKAKVVCVSSSASSEKGCQKWVFFSLHHHNQPAELSTRVSPGICCLKFKAYFPSRYYLLPTTYTT